MPRTRDGCATNRCIHVLDVLFFLLLSGIRARNDFFFFSSYNSVLTAGLYWEFSIREDRTIVNSISFLFFFSRAV